MEYKFIAGSAVAGLFLTGAIVGAVSAQSAATATGLTEAQAIEIALLEVPGDVQEVELEREDRDLVYEIEIINADGIEFEVEIDADSGAIFEVDAEDKDDCKDDNDDDNDDDDDGDNAEDA